MSCSVCDIDLDPPLVPARSHPSFEEVAVCLSCESQIEEQFSDDKCDEEVCSFW